MSQLKKLIARMSGAPRDFTWDEMCSVLEKLGFEKQQGSGARVAFRDPVNAEHVIHLHMPHGRSPKTVLVKYVNDTVKQLREWGKIV